MTRTSSTPRLNNVSFCQILGSKMLFIEEATQLLILNARNLTTYLTSLFIIQLHKQNFKQFLLWPN